MKTKMKALSLALFVIAAAVFCSAVKTMAANSQVQPGDTAIQDGNYTFSGTGVTRVATGTVALPLGVDGVRNIAVDNIGRTIVTQYVHKKTSWTNVASSTRIFVQNSVFRSSAQTYNDNVFGVFGSTFPGILRKLWLGDVTDGDRIRIWDARGDTTAVNVVLVYEKTIYVSTPGHVVPIEFDIPLSSGLTFKHTGTSGYSLGWDETISGAR